MLPNPLHPAVVHFPIVLSVLFPLVALFALWRIRHGMSARRAWGVPVVLAAGLALSAWVAIQTGEGDEEAVEEVVSSEQAIHEHEEAAERFMLLSGTVLLISFVGLAGGTIGAAGRILSTVGAVGLVAAGVQVGKAGGELVYEHGAAQAYVRAAQDGAPNRLSATLEEAEDDDD